MVMKRYPNGSDGKCFFMKRAPSPRPDVGGDMHDHARSTNVIDFPMAQDLASLLWLVNLGCIDLNPWYARCDDVSGPTTSTSTSIPVPRRAVRRRARGRPAGARGARDARDGLAREDQRLERASMSTCRSCAADAEAGLDVHEGVRPHWLPASRRLTAEYRVADAPARARAGGLQPERARPHAGVGVLAAAEATGAGLHTGDLGRGRRGIELADFRIDNVPARFEQLGDLWTPLLARAGRFDLEHSSDAGAAARSRFRYPPMEAGGASSTSCRPAPSGSTSPSGTASAASRFAMGRRSSSESKAGKPLGRYFPELVALLLALPARSASSLTGRSSFRYGDALSFDELLLRIHPATSRIERLAAEHPASLVVFDLLADERGRALVDEPLADAGVRLEDFSDALPRGEPIVLSRPRAAGDRPRWLRSGGWRRTSTASSPSASTCRTTRASARHGEGEAACAPPTASSAASGMPARAASMGSLLLGLYDDERAAAPRRASRSSLTRRQARGRRGELERSARATRLHRAGARAARAAGAPSARRSGSRSRRSSSSR